MRSDELEVLMKTIIDLSRKIKELEHENNELRLTLDALGEHCDGMESLRLPPTPRS